MDESKDHEMYGEVRESRRYPRFQSKRVVRFRQEDGSEIKSIFKIINVSQGGLQIACQDRIAPETVFCLDIDAPEFREPLLLKAKVIWINASPDANGLYYSGVTFLNIQDDARAIVLRAISQ